jgi:hypothetical protein
MRTWQIILSQLFLTVSAAVYLVFTVHFPDVTRRPIPPPTNVLFTLLIWVALGAITFAFVGATSTKAHTGIVLWSSLVFGLLGCYALLFIWVNTFGT